MKLRYLILALLTINPLLSMDRPIWQRVKSAFKSDKNIFEAAANGDLKTIQKMIAKKEKVDLNQKDAQGNTPLMIAARNGHVDVVNALIKAGVDLKSKNNMDNNAMFIAVYANKPAVLKALLTAGQSPNQREEFGLGGGKTLLMIATQNNFTEIVRLLAEAGADIGARQVERMPTKQTTAGEMMPKYGPQEMRSFIGAGKKEKIP